MKNPHKEMKASGKLSSVIVLILFFSLGIVVTAILNLKLSKDQQTVKSEAQVLSPIQEAACTSKGGECQNGKSDQVGKECTLSDGSTKGTVAFNLCPQQTDDVRCCVPKSTSNPPVSQTNKATMTVGFQGIGPNSNPQNRTRTVSIKIFKNEGPFESATYVAQDTITFDPQTGFFKSANFNLGSIPEGKYQMVLQEETYLDVQLLDKSGNKVFEMSSSATIETSPVQMRAGDLAPGDNGDNQVNIIDYNALIGCLPGAPTGACFNKDYSDMNDDGKVDQVDLDILLSNFGDNGFAFQTEEFKCEPDPACGAEKDTLQLCSLLCTKKTQRS
ncbi:MAG TPA: dockerin type I domain-containing protein [Candidatus Limnocylindrales bacterium]|nr:dockerin type I domain-containing protein [Candidatus Limnocylindrales bacterium]